MANGRDPNRIPVISIQCDWDEVIFSSDEEIWISFKFKGENSVHSKLVAGKKRLPWCVTGQFSILSLEEKFVEIKFNPTGHVSVFLAASRILSKIHVRNAISLNVTNAVLGVSVCAGGRFAVWNASTGDPTTELRGHHGDVYKCRFFPSGLVVLSAGADMTLKIWCAETGQCAATLVGHLGPVNDFCIVDRGRNVISVSKDGTAKLWDCGKSACLSTIFQASHAFNCCALRNLPEPPDAAGKEQYDDREIGTKNKLLIIGSEGGSLYGIAVFSRKKLFSVVVGSAVNVVLVLGDIIVAGCQSGVIKIYRYCEGKGTAAVRTFDESSSPVLCGSSYKDKGFFIGRGDGTVTYYDCLYFCNKRIYLTGPNIDTISDMCLTDGVKLYTCCRDGKIREYLIGETMSRYYNRQ